MRPIESYLMYAAMYALIAQYAWFPHAIAYFTLTIFACHLYIEHPRYQFYIVYLIVCLTSYALLTNTYIHWLYVVLGEILLIISSAVACLIKVATLPLPSGPYKQVGITTFYVHTEDFDGHPTECLVHAFYPSSTTPTFPSTATSFLSSFSPNSSIYLHGYPGSGPATMPREIARSIMRFAKFPFFLMDSVPLTKIHAKQDAEIVKGEHKLPVILFSHGLGATPESYNIAATDLASYGYVVLLPTHNDGSACLSLLPTGRRIIHDRIPSKFLNTPEEYIFRHRQLRHRVRECGLVMKSVIAAETSGDKNTWKQLCHRGEKIPSFAGRLDVTKGWGVVGHSFGGATVTEWARQQPQIKAVILLDIWTLPLSEGLIAKGLQQPVLMMQSDHWLRWPTSMQQCQQLFDASHPDSRFFTMSGSGHISFSDIPVYSPFVNKKVGQIGPLNVFRAYQIMNHYNAAFLLHHIPVEGTVYSEKERKEIETLLDVKHKVQPKEVVWHSKTA